MAPLPPPLQVCVQLLSLDGCAGMALTLVFTLTLALDVFAPTSSCPQWDRMGHCAVLPPCSHDQQARALCWPLTFTDLDILAPTWPWGQHCLLCASSECCMKYWQTPGRSCSPTQITASHQDTTNINTRAVPVNLTIFIGLWHCCFFTLCWNQQQNLVPSNPAHPFIHFVWCASLNVKTQQNNLI